jgi:hypothetical protein
MIFSNPKKVNELTILESSRLPFAFQSVVAHRRRAVAVMLRLTFGVSILRCKLKKFDAQSVFFKKRIPELNTPNYPRPIVDHLTARVRA